MLKVFSVIRLMFSVIGEFLNVGDIGGFYFVYSEHEKYFLQNFLVVLKTR